MVFVFGYVLVYWLLELMQMMCQALLRPAQRLLQSQSRPRIWMSSPAALRLSNGADSGAMSYNTLQPLSQRAISCQIQWKSLRLEQAAIAES